MYCDCDMGRTVPVYLLQQQNRYTWTDNAVLFHSQYHHNPGIWLRPSLSPSARAARGQSKRAPYQGKGGRAMIEKLLKRVGKDRVSHDRDA